MFARPVHGLLAGGRGMRVCRRAAGNVIMLVFLGLAITVNWPQQAATLKFSVRTGS